MSDLISRQAAIEEVARRDTTDGTVKVYSGREVIGILQTLPSAQPDTPMRGSITPKTGENGDDRTTGDCISRQAAIDAPERFIKDCNPEHFVGHQKFIEFMDDDEIGSFGNWQFANGFNMGLTAAEVAIKKLPSATQEHSEDCISRAEILYHINLELNDLDQLMPGAIREGKEDFYRGRKYFAKLMKMVVTNAEAVQ